MIVNDCMPYIETQITALSSTMVMISTPWAFTRLKVPKNVVQAIIAKNPKGINYVLQRVSPLPMCAIMPRRNPFPLFWKHNKEPSIERSILPSFTHNCWDIDMLLIKSKIKGTNTYDPLALLSQIRYQIYSNPKQSKNENLLTRLANYSDKSYINLADVIMSQILYIEQGLIHASKFTIQCQKSRLIMGDYLIAANGPEAALRQSLQYLRANKEDDLVKIFNETKTIVGVLVYAAKHHPLSFAILLDWVTEVQKSYLMTLGKIMMHIESLSKSTQHLRKFIHLKNLQQRELHSFRIAANLGPTNGHGATAAILTSFTVHSLLKRCDEKIAFKSNAIIATHPPLVLLKKVT